MTDRVYKKSPPANQPQGTTTDITDPRSSRTGTAGAIERPAGARILVAEDDPLVLSMVTTALDYYGYQVQTVADGEEALNVFREQRAAIDLVFLDQSMPKVSGLRVYQALRRSTPPVAVLLTSGYSCDRSIRADSDPLFRFIGKPYPLPKLIALIQELLTAAAARCPAAVDPRPRPAPRR